MRMEHDEHDGFERFITRPAVVLIVLELQYQLGKLLGIY